MVRGVRDEPVRVFISSVRRGLEEERDALPGLILAVGHTPIRFEDFTAQSLPSREACLAGIATADAYLLLLGPNYGHRFDDTGQSPTHDEWMAATTAGLPRLVYRKTGVEFESDQQDFSRSIGDYASGVFYDSFAATPELLTKVAAKLREFDQANSPLTFAPLTEPVAVTWRADFDPKLRNNSSLQSALELHVVPAGARSRRPSRIMAELADLIPTRVRESALVSASEALSTTRPGGAVVVSIAVRPGEWNSPREPQLLGVRLGVDGQASAWATLPGDSMGAILDATQLPEQIADLLRLVGLLRVVDTSEIAVAVGVDPAMMLSTGRVAQLPRQSASMLSTSDRPVRVPPDEHVSSAALNVGALEVARSLSRALFEAVGSRR
jgi:hypothetical protein